MNSAALWQRYQDWLYHHEGLGFYVDVSRMRFEDGLVEALKPKFEQAFQDMADLEAGAIANPDEDRMVGSLLAARPRSGPHSRSDPTGNHRQS